MAAMRPWGAALMVLVLGSGRGVEARAAGAGAHPATEPEALTLELGVFGGIFVAADDHELYDFRLSHRTFRNPILEAGARLSLNATRHFALEAEASLGPADIRGPGEGTIYLVGAHAILQYPARVTPFILLGGAAAGIQSSSAELGDDTDPMFRWGVGAKAYLSDLFLVRADVRHLVAGALDRDTSQTLTNHLEVLLGLSLTFPRASREPPDADRDRVPNEVDACPERAGPRRNRGCPILDSDGDGLADDEDACPREAGGLRGCLDRDGDGVADVNDACPDEAGEAEGCPAAPHDESEPPSGPEEEDVAGADTASPAPGAVPSTGVSPAARALEGPLEGVNFTTASARLRGASFAILDRVAALMLAAAHLSAVIEGHTDNVGGRATNVALSQSRAEAVKRYLEKAGVASHRLEAVGLGPDAPTASNRTRQGRALNRRIELKWRTGSATDAEPRR